MLQPAYKIIIHIKYCTEVSHDNDSHKSTVSDIVATDVNLWPFPKGRCP